MPMFGDGFHKFLFIRSMSKIRSVQEWILGKFLSFTLVIIITTETGQGMFWQEQLLRISKIYFNSFKGLGAWGFQWGKFHFLLLSTYMK